MAGVLAAAATLSACGTSIPNAGRDPNSVDLVGRTFIGDDVKVDDSPQPLAQGTTLRVSFEKGTVGASAGCNSMSGPATWDSGVLIVDERMLSTTEMACSEPVMAQDTWLADLLTSKPRLIESTTTLTLTSDNTVVVLTDEESAVSDVDLTGTMWQLDSLATAGTVSSVPAGVESTVEFAADGGVVAFLGCNGGRGSYSVRGNHLVIEPLATTKKACPPPASDVESSVASLLQGKVAYSIDGNTLILTATKVTGPGPTTLIYRAA